MATNPINTLLAGGDPGNSQSKTSEVLGEVVRELANRDGESAASLSQFSREVQQLNATNQGQTQAVSENTQAVQQNTVVQSSSSKGSTAGKIAQTVLGSGLGLSPLITGIMHLFGGGGETAPPPLVPYAKPAPVTLEGAVSGGAGLGSVGYGADGLPRATTPSSPPSQPAPQITVQVQAMDSRSFLDRQEEIARAVRQAMLNSHSLNDVVNDL